MKTRGKSCARALPGRKRAREDRDDGGDDEGDDRGVAPLKRRHRELNNIKKHKGDNIRRIQNKKRSKETDSEDEPEKSKKKDQPKPKKNQYSGLKKDVLREMMQPYGITGLGQMLKNELVQLCLLYVPDVPPADASGQASGINSKIQAINIDFREPMIRNHKEAPPATTNTTLQTSEAQRPQQPSPQAPAHMTSHHIAESHTHHSSRQATADIEVDELDDNPTGIEGEHQLPITHHRQESCDRDEDNTGSRAVAAEVNRIPSGTREAQSQHHARDLTRRAPADTTNYHTPSRNNQDGVVLPSRERGTALPLPRPTVLSAVAKGKRRAITPPSDNDWHPESDDEQSDDSLDLQSKEMEVDDDLYDHFTSDIEGNHQLPTTLRHQESRENMDVTISTDSTRDEDDTGSRAAMNRILAANVDRTPSGSDNSINLSVNESDDLQQQQAVLLRHVKASDLQMKELTKNVKDLTKVVMSMAGGRLPVADGVMKKKSKHASQFMARIRSHAWVLMGLKKHEPIPPSATPAQFSTWKKKTTKSEMLSIIRLDGLNADSNLPVSDPCFPYRAGPGGENTNPQVLSIMWTMMKHVGVASFRPIWEETMKSARNIFLWKLATAIFIQLVKCGEYDEITPQDAQFDVILGALIKHAKDVLKREFVKRNTWSMARQQITQKRMVRGQRRRGMKDRRIRWILHFEELLSLCDLVEKCCSDDETDWEDGPDGQRQKVYKVKNLPWRSAALTALILKLERYEECKKKDSPKGTRGVKPRTRIRDTVMALSDLEAPSGLPIDCYDADWLESLQRDDPEKYDELDIDFTPVLAELERRANALLVT